MSTINTTNDISKFIENKIHTTWQNGNAVHRQFTIGCPSVGFGKGRMLISLVYIELSIVLILPIQVAKIPSKFVFM